jgi:hypothetical protein
LKDVFVHTWKMGEILVFSRSNVDAENVDVYICM